MNITKRVVSALVCIVIAGWAVFTAATATPAKLEEEVPSNDGLVIWYTDDSLSNFMEAACVAYNEMYGVRVVPKLQSGDEYLEQVNKASIENDSMPDLYVITNDMLERAYLGGLAHIVDTDVVNQNHFSPAALQSVTYRGNPVAYPFYFETSAMLYNRTYLFNMAQNQIMAEDSTEPDEEEANEDEAEEEVLDNPEADMTPEERIEYRIQQSLPDTFDELMEFADTYDAPMEVETVFKWDVKDIFYNYFFVGNYINIGGENGDDPSVIDIYNMDTITALTLYQDLNQFFSFDYEDISYESVLREFIEGKMVFTTATSDAIKVLEQAKADGEFEYEYGVMRLPQL
ncbi:MAG: extracellular solute-binding protein, partial [Lachnospiraceae bacterium]|nr:extracellular solute-binding protein [Lachnospiraceae bacterium]